MLPWLVNFHIFAAGIWSSVYCVYLSYTCRHHRQTLIINILYVSIHCQAVMQFAKPRANYQLPHMHYYSETSSTDYPAWRNPAVTPITMCCHLVFSVIYSELISHLDWPLASSWLNSPEERHVDCSFKLEFVQRGSLLLTESREKKKSSISEVNVLRSPVIIIKTSRSEPSIDHPSIEDKLSLSMSLRIKWGEEQGPDLNPCSRTHHKLGCRPIKAPHRVNVGFWCVWCAGKLTDG